MPDAAPRSASADDGEPRSRAVLYLLDQPQPLATAAVQELGRLNHDHHDVSPRS